MSNCALIVAAGKGTRFGQPKQFYNFHGRPLFLYALEQFEKNSAIDMIILVVPKHKIRFTQNLIKKFGYKKTRHIVSGGRRRQDSVLKGLQKIHEKSGIVIIHDGIRPIVTNRIIKKGIKLCRKYHAVIPGIPIYETIKQVNKNLICRTVSRNNLYLIQTPQFFKINLIKNGFRKANMRTEYTDEAALIESLGHNVHLFTGDLLNIKITKKSDLKILNKFLS